MRERLRLLTRQKRSWSPGLVLGLIWRAVCNVSNQWSIREILKLPEYAELARIDLRFRFRYLARDYLSKRFTVAERACCFSHHYEWLHNHLSSAFLSKILHEAVPLVEVRDCGNSYTIACSSSRPIDTEGDLSLNLEVNGETVFILSFNIVPGRVVRSPAADVLLITRMQGVKGCYPQISLATRTMRCVAPPALLVAALEGLGDALGIRTLACISGTDQNSYCSKSAAYFGAAYDAFFIARGVNKNEANIFVSPIPMNEKPLALIKKGHKLRAKRRHAFKRMVAEAARQAFYEYCHGRNEAPMPVRFDPVA
jgi:uncharacterized protein VirK/YbjX